MNEGAIPRTPKPDDEPGWKLRLEARLRILDPIQLIPFRSFGVPTLLHLRGRVRERRELRDGEDQTSVWDNLVNLVRRIDSDEVPGAQVRVVCQGATWEATTDNEGFFALDVPLDEPVEPGWHTLEVELAATLGEPAEQTVSAKVLVPHPDAAFAVVSDVDDTIVETHSSDWIRQLAIQAGKSAKERTALAGVPSFYRALARAEDDAEPLNPIFYVSRSGWNLHDLFVAFMEAHDIPRGPLFLSDLRVVEDQSTVLGSNRHKFESIDLLLRTYAELSFILIGDSGQHDPELYADLVRKHPGRIAAIYIHDVSGDTRDAEVEAIAEELAGQGVPLVRGDTMASAAEHAAGEGYITTADLEAVRKEVAETDTHSAEDR